MIIFVNMLIFLLLVVFTLAFSSLYFDQGFSICISLVLGVLTTYIFLTTLCIILHFLIRRCVGKKIGYLPFWKVPLWGIMAALHYLLFFSVRVLIPRDYLPNYLLRAFGMKIGSKTINMGLILDPEMILLGNNVYIGSGVCLSGHVMLRPDRKVFRAPIVIEDGVRIGQNTVVAPGVHIGANALILPNTYVPANWKLEGGKFYGGCPAIEIQVS